MPPKPTLHRVIRDVRDARMDLWITREALAKLEARGQICYVNCYSGRWTPMLERKP